MPLSLATQEEIVNRFKRDNPNITSFLLGRGVESGEEQLAQILEYLINKEPFDVIKNPNEPPTRVDPKALLKNTIKEVFEEDEVETSFIEILINHKYFNCAQMLIEFDDTNQIGQTFSIKTLFSLIQDSAKGDKTAEQLLFEILHKGYDINKRWSFTRTSLLEICLRDNPTLAIKLIDEFSSKIDFSSINNYNENLLHFAVKNTNYDRDIISTLIKKGVNPLQKDIYGKTPFDWAISNGDVVAAQKLSGLSTEEIKNNPAFNKKLITIDHSKMVKNITKFLTTQSLRDPSTKLAPMNILGGVCNGWSFMAALHASQGDEELEKLYKKCWLLCTWDGTKEKLLDPAQIPLELRQEGYENLNSLFIDITNEIYWFYHQHTASFGLSRSDRVRQVGMVSEKFKLKEVCDLELDDMTTDEAELVLSTLKPFLNECIVDSYNNAHDMSFYQDKNANARFFDPNHKLMLDKMQNYKDNLDASHPIINKNFSNFGIFHTKPEKVTPEYQRQIDEKMLELIDKLILKNPARMQNLDNIIINAGFLSSPYMIRTLLKHPILSDKFSPEAISRAIERSSGRSNFRSLYEFYKANKVVFKDLRVDVLEGLLKTGFLFDDQKLVDLAKTEIERQNQKEEIRNGLFGFKLIQPNKGAAPLKLVIDNKINDVKAKENYAPSGVDLSAKKPILHTGVKDFLKKPEKLIQQKNPSEKAPKKKI